MKSIAQRLLVAALGVLLTAYPTNRLTAQDSHFSVRGLGTPGRWESVWARSTGGAFAPFDPTSPLAEAALAVLGPLTAGAALATTYRDSDVGGETTSLRSTRFPVMTLGGPVLGRWMAGGGFSTYLDRSYSVVIPGDTVIRDSVEAYSDTLTSDGGVSDIRFAVARRLARGLDVGVGVHLLSGSTRVIAVRGFEDSTYAPAREVADIYYEGFGLSASFVAGLGPTLRVAGWARSDRRLRAQRGDAVTAEHELPTHLGGAVRWQPAPAARGAAAVSWRSWSDAGGFDTFNWSAGAEIGARLPVRVGVRGGRLPFGPGGTAPTERGFAAGTGLSFAEGRGVIDLGIERLTREGAGLRETAWTLMLGVTVRP